MKKLTQFLMILGCFTICIAVTNNVSAQKKAQNDDEKYLAGAVPEVDGKVVFTKEFSIPGMSADEIYKRTYAWMEARLKKNENTSRIVYTTPEEGLIVGIGDEWIVFKSNALSLDRSRITYQLTATCQPEQCTLEISKIRYIYREGEERYTAEEWITDEYALNKPKTKLVRGLGLMLAVLFQDAYKNTDAAKKAAENGLLLIPAGANALRFQHALNVKADDVKRALKLLEKTVKEL